MKQENTNNQPVMIEDLSAQNTEEIKGGPKRIFIGGLSVTESATSLQIEDLQVSDTQSSQIAGGLPAVQACREAAGNHNETVSEDSEAHAEEAATEKFADLTVDESTEAEIKGGPLLTSVQYPYK